MADRSGIKVTASDALEFESVAPKAKRGGGAIKTVLFVIVAVFVGAGGWAFYGERLMTMFSSSENEIPTLRADISPIKVRPENPGGLQVPDRDKLVYNRIQNGGSTNNNSGSAVERLLPPPETPLPMPKTASVTPVAPPTSAPTPSVSNTPKISEVTSAVRPAPAPEAPAAPNSLNEFTQQSNAVPEIPQTGPTRLSKSAPATDPAASNTVTKPVVAPQPAAPQAAATQPVQTAAVTPRPSAPPASTAAPTGKVYRVQLAAARTPEAARKEWDRLRRGNLDILGDLGLSVTRIDLGGSKGVFYRLRAGPLDGDKDARALCKILAQRKIGCLVVRPGK